MNNMTRAMALALAVAGTASVASAAVIWADDFSGSKAGSYNIYKVSYTATPAVGPDAFVSASYDFGGAWPYDGNTYTGSAATHRRGGAAIPSAPGSVDTLAGMVYVNKNLTETTSTEAAGLSPKVRFVGDVTVTVDVWTEVTTSGTSTQLSFVGMDLQKGLGFHQNASSNPILNLGHTFGVIADGSSTRDYREYRAGVDHNPTGGTGNVVGGGFQATGTGITNNSNAYYTSYFIGGTPKYTGTTGMQWVTYKLQRVGDLVTFSLRNNDATENPSGNFLKISEFTDTTTVRGGYVELGHFDPAGSPSPADQPLFTLFDNFKIEGTKAPTVSGNLTINGRDPGFPANVTMRCFDSGGVLIESQVVAIDANGDYSLDVLPNTASLFIDAFGTFLSKRLSVDVSGGDVSGQDMVLGNGDSNDDNSCDLLDYFNLSDSYNLALGDSGYNAECDFNGDESVDLLDYFILSDNYNTLGDE